MTRETKIERAERRAEIISQRDELVGRGMREGQKLRERFRREWDELERARGCFPTGEIYAEAGRQLMQSQRDRIEEQSVQHRVEMIMLNHQARKYFTPDMFAPPRPRVPVN
jgi:hypothetical protein